MYRKKAIAGFFLSLLMMQLASPLTVSALSSGPTQPEVQSFEPVGTADMVDPFTGDFVYNIPLLDVDGYPINIAYHGGVGMDQEASWVGLGWNINPGVVNRAVRGLPDDFSGDTIEKDLHIKSEYTTKVGLGVGAELFGASDPMVSLDANLGAALTFNNYRGVSLDLISSFTAQLTVQPVSLGFNAGAGIGSQSGASVDYGAFIGLGASQSISKDAALNGSFNLNYGGTYSPRTGLRRNAGFNVSLGYSNSAGQRASMSTGATVPIGLQNFTPAITTKTNATTIAGRLKLGGELFGIYGNANVNGSYSEVHFDGDGSRPGYGYNYYEAATAAADEGILDFSREKDGMFNNTMHFLPQATTTYDVYSVQGQGTGGSFRPFRNDYGSVYDPKVSSGESKNESYTLEAGLGNAFSLGGDGSIITTKVESGPWEDYRNKFSGEEVGSLYEKVYYKEAGELTVNDPGYLSEVGGTGVVSPDFAFNMPLKRSGSTTGRTARANYVAIKAAQESIVKGTGSQDSLRSYTSTNGFAGYASAKTIPVTKIGRYSNGQEKLKRKLHHASEVIQVQKDGRKYVYGLPVVNNVQKEATFAIDPASSLGQPLVGYSKGIDDSKVNGKGLDEFYSATVTPTYSSAYLLTAVYSADYADITGDGPSDDDLGSFTRFNYSRKNKDYRWRAPIEEDSAQYTAGYYSDKKDDKGSYIIGSREQWMLHSIETKNSIAEFYVSERKDGKGVKSAIFKETGAYYKESPYDVDLADRGSSYKLDSIKLYNKQDRLLNGASAVPIKTVFFEYDYSLCKKLPNADGYPADLTIGKLTLRKISFRYGNSGLSLISPYQFNYSDVNPDYSTIAKDRWGTYKPNNPAFNNFEFPYTLHGSTADSCARAWSLTDISLPSGGAVKVNYEADDYAYVQNLEAMEMVPVTGFGSSTRNTTGTQLYFDKSSPNLFMYFRRDVAREIPGRSLGDQYLKGTKIVQYKVPVDLVPGAAYEPVKGYAEVDDIGICPDPAYGYIKLKSFELEGGARLSPIVLTALNMGRYNLPHLFYPGTNPEGSDIDNIVSGLWYGIKELVSMHKNPLELPIKEKRAKQADLSKAYVRLTSPGLAKKGGGQRVKSIYFTDNWKGMVGGTDSTAVYGKVYDYTTWSDDHTARISSGVASYEPSTGGDENPFRQPVYFTTQEGSVFPPNDPIDLYQELPLCESFFPSPVVGYSRVEVKSIHFENGRSSQVKDQYEFYTARNYPVKTEFSPLQASDNPPKIGIKGVTIQQDARQGFAVTLNDMHGKPKATSKIVVSPKGTEEIINYQQFTYKMGGTQLKTVANNNGTMKLGMSSLGLDVDVCLDSRHRKEETRNQQLSGNLNGFFVAIIPVVLPLIYPWSMKSVTEFNCATATKVIQQYGIVTEVKNVTDGTVTNVKNEAYDGLTGSPVITSVNNEFNDREYTINYPAYWGYKGMGPVYQNAGYSESFAKMEHANPSSVGTSMLPMATANNTGYINTTGSALNRFRIGDEIQVSYESVKQGGTIVANQGYFVGRVVDLYYLGDYTQTPCYNLGYQRGTGRTCGLIIQPNLPAAVPFWTSFDSVIHPTLKIINSGYSSQLTEVSQSVVTADTLNFSNGLADSLKDLISQKGTLYSRNTTSTTAQAATNDSLNVYLSGKLSKVYRPWMTVAPNKARTYVGTTSRNSGLFNSKSLFQKMSTTDWDAIKMGGLPSGACTYESNLTLEYATYSYPGSYRVSNFWSSRGFYQSSYDLAGGPYLWGNGFYTIPAQNANQFLISNVATKYDAHGTDLENLNAIGNPTAAQYGYNAQQAVAVSQNAPQGGYFAENFEDLDMLLPKAYPSAFYQVPLLTPIQPFFTSTLAYGDYIRRSPSNVNLSLSSTESHSGYKSMLVGGSNPYIEFPIGFSSAGGNCKDLTLNAKLNKTFAFVSNATYIASIWLKPQTINAAIAQTSYIAPSANFSLSNTTGSSQAVFTAKSDIIDGWQQFEVQFTPVTAGTGTYKLRLPKGYYFDDLRIFPTQANMKSFVYNVLNGKLMATLDENNFANFYEYDAEGNLIRTKKETEKGVLTITESRQAHPKTTP